MFSREGNRGVTNTCQNTTDCEYSISDIQALLFSQMCCRKRRNQRPEAEAVAFVCPTCPPPQPLPIPQLSSPHTIPTQHPARPLPSSPYILLSTISEVPHGRLTDCCPEATTAMLALAWVSLVHLPCKISSTDLSCGHMPAASCFCPSSTALQLYWAVMVDRSSLHHGANPNKNLSGALLAEHGPKVPRLGRAWWLNLDPLMPQLQGTSFVHHSGSSH